MFGAILALVGFFVTVCGFGQNELGISFVIAGLASASIGCLIFIVKFKQWFKNI